MSERMRKNPDRGGTVEEGIHRILAEAMGEVLAQVTEPYFLRTDEHFCSHCQRPPKCVNTGEAAIVKNDSAVYISAPLSSMYCEYGYSVYKEIVRRCIELLCPKPLIETDLSSISEVYLRKKGEKRNSTG